MTTYYYLYAFSFFIEAHLDIGCRGYYYLLDYYNNYYYGTTITATYYLLLLLAGSAQWKKEVKIIIITSFCLFVTFGTATYFTVVCVDGRPRNVIKGPTQRSPQSIDATTLTNPLKKKKATFCFTQAAKSAERRRSVEPQPQVSTLPASSRPFSQGRTHTTLLLLQLPFCSIIFWGRSTDSAWQVVFKLWEEKLVVNLMGCCLVCQPRETSWTCIINIAQNLLFASKWIDTSVETTGV